MQFYYSLYRSPSSKKDMFKIFLSYRTNDSGYAAPHIYLRLAEIFGDENVFEYNDAMPAGVNFRQHVINQLQQIQVFIVLIGANWVDNIDPNGQLRLQQSDDPVRIEIEAALANSSIRIIPVYLYGITGLNKSKLPPSISDIVDLSAIPIGTKPYELKNGVDRLIDEIKSQGVYPRPSINPEITRLKNELLQLEARKISKEKIYKRKKSLWNNSVIAIPICLVLTLIGAILSSDFTALLIFLAFIIFITACCIIIFGNPRKIKKELTEIEKEILLIKSQLNELEGKRK